MNNTISSMYWNQHKELCLEILKYEFQGEANVSDYTYGNDASPSLIIQGKEYRYVLYLPSNYQGDYSVFSLFEVFEDLDDKFLMSFSTMEEFLDYCKLSLNII